MAALAFGDRAPAVDGNVDRVFARLLAAKGEWKKEKTRIAALVRTLVPVDRPGEFAEALMDLGATLCTPKKPDCLLCPVREWCSAHAEGDPARYPLKPEKKTRPKRFGEVFFVQRSGEVLVERRPETGLLGGMLGLPTTDWRETGAGKRPAWIGSRAETIGEVRHVFTHFELRLDVVRADIGQAPAGFEWAPVKTVETALPSVFRKALKLAR